MSACCPRLLSDEYVRTAVTLPASSRRSASICSGVGKICGTGSWPEANGENAMPCTWAGHGGSGLGRFSQAHSANVNAAKTAATTMLDALIVLTYSLRTAPRCRQAASPASREEYTRCETGYFQDLP